MELGNNYWEIHFVKRCHLAGTWP